MAHPSSTLAERRLAWLTLLLLLGLAPLIVWQVRLALRSNSNDVRDWLPQKYPETVEYAEFLRLFGSEDFVAASWPGCTLSDPRLLQFADRLRTPERQVWFAGVITGKELLWQMMAAPSGMSKPTAVSRLEGTIVESVESAGDASPDSRATCAVLTLTSQGRRELPAMLAEISAAATEAGIPSGELKLGGPPVVNAAMNQESTQSLVRLAVLAMAIGLIIAWRCFHAWRLTAMVFAVGLTSAAISLAIVHLAGVPLNAILITMAPLVYVSGMSGAIHLTNYYLDAVAEGEPHPVSHAARHAMLPLALAAGTTAAGLLSLEFADLSPIRQFGRFSAIGIVVSVAVQFTLLPACLTLWPPPPRKRSAPLELADDVLQPTPLPQPPADTLVERLASAVIARRGWLTLLFLGILALGAYGLSRVETSIQIIRLFAPGRPILQHYSFLEKKLGGLVPMEVVLRFDKTNEQGVVSRLNMLQAIQRDVAKLPAVTGCLSAATFAPQIRGKSGGSLSGFILHRRLSKSGYVVENEDAEYWRLSVRVRAAEDLDYGQFQQHLRGQVEPHLAAAQGSGPATIRATYTGTVPIIYKARRSLLDGMILGFGTDVLLIVVAAMLATRHWSNGILLLLASIFPMLTVFGAMGLAGVVVDIGSVMTPCVALGVTVDD
ncbi:MAG: MMPL family transporter, partial [Pirellulaceae bacterium]|nr:MMPL family transporter [Pirellulaceae bacterium]